MPVAAGRCLRHCEWHFRRLAAGAIGGALIASAAGFSLQSLQIYAPLFYTGASAYLVAWLLICILAPGLRKAEMAA